MIIGWLDAVFKRSSELGLMFDVEMFIEKANRVHIKRIAIDTCISLLERTISQSEFSVKNGGEFEKDEIYYRLNVRPNKNMTASTFWERFIYKLIYDYEAYICEVRIRVVFFRGSGFFLFVELNNR